MVRHHHEGVQREHGKATRKRSPNGVHHQPCRREAHLAVANRPKEESAVLGAQRDEVRSRAGIIVARQAVGTPVVKLRIVGHWDAAGVWFGSQSSGDQTTIGSRGDAGGALENAKGRPAGGATLVVAPASSPQRRRPRERQTEGDREGRPSVVAPASVRQRATARVAPALLPVQSTLFPVSPTLRRFHHAAGWRGETGSPSAPPAAPSHSPPP